MISFDPAWACAVLLVCAFVARIGWGLGGLLLRWCGIGEPHTTNHFHGVTITQRESLIAELEQRNGA